MSNVAISFASIVKSNNGFFKSEAQAKFLLAQCQEENTFVTGGSVYKNSYTLFYICDAQGVVRVEKHLATSGKVEITFNRLSSEAHAAKVLAKTESVQRDIDLQTAAQAKYQIRLDAFQNALTIAKACTVKVYLSVGCTPEVADQLVNMMIVNQDSITANMPDLIKFPEFVKAWESYNKA